MGQKRYVQHISGQGEKWEVHGECGEWRWYVLAKDKGGSLSLPKSEYLLCDPPEQWVDLTRECDVEDNVRIKLNGMPLYGPLNTLTERGGSYRLSKVSFKEKQAFIVEKKVP